MIRKEHIKLLKSAYLRWDDCETGAPAIDPKRPYGNSNVEGDVREILGKTEDDMPDDIAMQIHRETLEVLQKILATLPDDLNGVYYKFTPEGFKAA